MNKAKLATVWLDGCSGCHMSFLDIDQRLLELLETVDLVYSPLMDADKFPEDVDVTLVEGGVSTNQDEQKIKYIRDRTRILIALGDCAMTGNVPAMSNPFGSAATLARAIRANVELAQAPMLRLPILLKQSRAVREVVKVDLVIPGCPPSAETIHFAVRELLAGRTPVLNTVPAD